MAVVRRALRVRVQMAVKLEKLRSKVDVGVPESLLESGAEINEMVLVLGELRDGEVERDGLVDLAASADGEILDGGVLKLRGLLDGRNRELRPVLEDRT